jgi:hypothetical protein
MTERAPPVAKRTLAGGYKPPLLGVTTPLLHHSITPPFDAPRHGESVFADLLFAS